MSQSMPLDHTPLGQCRSINAAHATIQSPMRTPQHRTQLRVTTWQGFEHSIDPLPRALAHTPAAAAVAAANLPPSSHTITSLTTRLRLYALHPDPDLAAPQDAVDGADAARRLRRWCQAQGPAGPVLFVLGAQALVVARPRDAADSIAWLMDRQRFTDALDVARVRCHAFDSAALTKHALG